MIPKLFRVSFPNSKNPLKKEKTAKRVRVIPRREVRISNLLGFDFQKGPFVLIAKVINISERTDSVNQTVLNIVIFPGATKNQTTIMVIISNIELIIPKKTMNCLIIFMLHFLGFLR